MLLLVSWAGCARSLVVLLLVLATAAAGTDFCGHLMAFQVNVMAFMMAF